MSKRFRKLKQEIMSDYICLEVESGKSPYQVKKPKMSNRYIRSVLHYREKERKFMKKLERESKE